MDSAQEIWKRKKGTPGPAHKGEEKLAKNTYKGVIRPHNYSSGTGPMQPKAEQGDIGTEYTRHRDESFEQVIARIEGSYDARSAIEEINNYIANVDMNRERRRVVEKTMSRLEKAVQNG